MGSLRVEHDWSNLAHTHTHTHRVAWEREMNGVWRYFTKSNKLVGGEGKGEEKWEKDKEESRW